MTKGMAMTIGLVIGFGVAQGTTCVQRAPDIAAAWGNARAEREKRLAAEAPQRAEAERAKREAQAAEEARQVANEIHNEANCKVTLKNGEMIAGIRRISSHEDRYGERCYHLHFGGDVTRDVGTKLIKTENCK